MKLRDFRYERIFALFYRLTRRLSNRQIMMLLAMIVGLLLGFIEIMTVAFMPSLSGYRDAFAFVVLVLVLLVRPTGLFGQRSEEKI